MIYEPIKTVFRIYDDISKQNRYLKNGRVDSLFPLYSPSDGILPWQMRVPIAGSGDYSFTRWRIINAISEVEAYDFDSHIPEVEYRRTTEGYDYFLHHGGIIDGVDIVPGSYYMEMDINSHTYVSEVFCVTNCLRFADLSTKYLRLEWDNDCGDLGPILFQTGWKDLVFLDTQLEKEEPTIYEEGTEDAYKDFVPTLRKYVDNLAFEANIPFYLVESLVIMSMANNVLLTTPGSIYSGLIKNIKTAVQQQATDNIYTLIAKFQQDTIYVNNACCDKMGLIDIPASGSGGSGGSGSGSTCTAPTIEASGLVNAVVDTPYLVEISISGTAPFFLSGITKPSWMDIEVDGSLVRLSGTPISSASGVAITFNAYNACGSDNLSTTINITDESTSTGVVILSNAHASGTITSADPDKFTFPEGEIPCTPGEEATGTHDTIEHPIFIWLGGAGISGHLNLSINGSFMECVEVDGPGMYEFNSYIIAASDEIFILFDEGACS